MLFTIKPTKTKKQKKIKLVSRVQKVNGFFLYTYTYFLYIFEYTFYITYLLPNKQTTNQPSKPKKQP